MKMQIEPSVSKLPPNLAALDHRLSGRLPYFGKVVSKRIEDFGQPWVEEFEEDLRVFSRATTRRWIRPTMVMGSHLRNGSDPTQTANHESD